MKAKKTWKWINSIFGKTAIYVARAKVLRVFRAVRHKLGYRGNANSRRKRLPR